MSLVGILSLVMALAPSPPERDSLARDQVRGELGARIDSQLTRFAEYGFSGTVLVAREGRIHLLKGYGLADVERGVPNRAATRFEMNSMTKMFTGAAILQLVARQRLQLSDPVGRYFRGLPPGKQAATIGQLATHTSGLIVEGSQLAGDSREAFVHDLAATPLESTPGERYRYSNAGFSLLAAIIEIVSGETYEQYLRRHLFTPAGMQSAGFRNEVPAADTVYAHGYVGGPAGAQPGPPNPYVWGTIGAGGVWSTVGDMYRWLTSVEGGRILPPAELRLLHATPKPPAEEAFGWHVHAAPDGRPRIDKGGGSDDFASQMLYYPGDQLIIVWASNDLRQRWRRALNQSLPAIAFGSGPIDIPRVASGVPADLAAHAGCYLNGADTLELRAGARCLYATAGRLGVPALVGFFPQDRDHFAAFDPATGSVTRFEFSADGGDSITVTDPEGGRRSARRSSRGR